jgi:hypothetical protein
MKIGIGGTKVSTASKTDVSYYGNKFSCVIVCGK